MFETAEVGNRIDKSTYKTEVPKLRQGLLEVQKELAKGDAAAIVIIGGVEGAGKAVVVNLMMEWMDARGIEIHAVGAPTDEERERPPMWRFWRMIPPKGHMAILLGSWYTDPVVNRVYGRSSDSELEQRLERIVDFEEMLAQEGFFLIKFWLHTSEATQRKRLKALGKDPLQGWRVKKLDWKFFKKYDVFRSVSEKALRRTNTEEAPWHIVEATDERYRNLTVGKTLLSVLNERLTRLKRRPKPRLAPDKSKPPAVNIIRNLDMSLSLPKKKYDKQLLKGQAELNLLTRRLYEEKRSMILVFEGPDAAGKGGAIRRLMAAMDARNYRVISIAAPTDEERAHPYLWRFWRHLPRLGRVTIYDRSWYGRVLVERVEGFCSRPEWQRAYREINAFEESLTDFGIIVLKFWIAVSSEEQLRRFKDRQATPYKQYKITEEDWRNRAKWDAYEAAAVDMIEKTSTELAPWVLVEGADKPWARLKVLHTVIERLKRELK